MSPGGGYWCRFETAGDRDTREGRGQSTGDASSSFRGRRGAGGEAAAARSRGRRCVVAASRRCVVADDPYHRRSERGERGQQRRTEGDHDGDDEREDACWR
eukprot:gene16997-biopygen10203